MRNESFPQYAIVQGHTAEDLTEQLNDVLRKLRDRQPEVTFEGLIARVRYIDEIDHIPETLGDEYQLKGVRLTCEQCPYFEAKKKSDGSPDLRAKGGFCPICKSGVTTRNRAACEVLFNAINNGEVELCFAK